MIPVYQTKRKFGNTVRLISKMVFVLCPTDTGVAEVLSVAVADVWVFKTAAD